MFGHSSDDKAGSLEGRRVALLCTDGVEESELLKPREALDAAGAETVLISIRDGEIQAWNHDKPSQKIAVDQKVSAAEIAEFDALVLPGGVMNPDTLRTDDDAITFIKNFFETGKPVAAICHGPWTLIEAGVVRGKKMTSWPSLKTDLRNAGAVWADMEVIVDGNLVTSRNPGDLPAFNRELIQLIERHANEGHLLAQHMTEPFTNPLGVAPMAQI